MLWAEEEMRAGKLPQKAAQVLEAVLYRGELPRADVAAFRARIVASRVPCDTRPALDAGIVSGVRSDEGHQSFLGALREIMSLRDIAIDMSVYPPQSTRGKKKSLS